MGEVKGLGKYIDRILEESSSIVERHKNYKNAYQKYEKNPKNLNNDERELVEKYKNFIDQVRSMIEKNGFSDEIMKAFLEPKGIAEAIASTITFKPTQLRKLFHQIKAIKQEVKGKDSLKSHEISLIKILPLLAYSKGRGLISEDFFELCKTLIKKVRESLNKEDFNKFVDIFEAIVAYHKYYNPKEN